MHLLNRQRPFRDARHFGRYGALAFDHLVELLAGHPKAFCSVGDAQAQLIDVVPDQTAGMGGFFIAMFGSS